MYSGDIYSCSVGNPFISDSETNHIINSHTHSGQLEKQSVCSVPEGLSEISSLAWKTLSLTPSLYEIKYFSTFFAFAYVSTPWRCFILRLSLLFILFYLLLPLGRICQVLVISRCSFGEPVRGPTSYFQRLLCTTDLMNPTPAAVSFGWVCSCLYEQHTPTLIYLGSLIFSDDTSDPC